MATSFITNMTKLSLTLILGLGLLLVAPSLSRGEESKKINDRFDEFLRKTIIKYDKELEPLVVPEQMLGFSQKIGPFNVSAEAKLFNILLAGMSTLRRVGPATLTKGANLDHELTVKLALGIMFYELKGNINFMGFGPTLTFEGKVIHVEGDLVVNIDGVFNTPSLKKFTLHELEGVELTVDGPGIILDAVTNKVISLAINNLTRTLKFVIGTALGRVLGAALPQATFLNELTTN